MGYLTPLLLLVISLTLISTADPNKWKAFLTNNLYTPHCDADPTFPLSYFEYPSTYYGNVPADMHVPEIRRAKEAKVVPACHNRNVEPDLLNAYQYQTEQWITKVGLNIYDGAVWMIALEVLGNDVLPQDYLTKVLYGVRTCQFGNGSIMADAACGGVMEWGQCTDPNQIGKCGFCYGDDPPATVTRPNAWFFRAISNIFALEGVYDARCPDLKVLWTWNDYKPILGENAWARLTAPLQTAYLRHQKDINSIPDSELAFSAQFIPSVAEMLVPSVGGVHYAPHNTYEFDGLAGQVISTENQASLLAGLKIFQFILTNKASKPYQSLLPTIANLITNIERYLKSAYDPTYQYFRQGGHYDYPTKTWTWVKEPFFAVDCQTWVMSVLGPVKIDGWFGTGTAAKIWEQTKIIGGYGYDSTSGNAKGLGYSNNTVEQVFSGEWSFGGVNMLRVFAAQYPDPTLRAKFAAEATFMRNAIDNELVQTHTINRVPSTGVLYANKRYYIPFGWWANPFLAASSTGWAALADSNYNPFMLGGNYTVY